MSTSSRTTPKLTVTELVNLPTPPAPWYGYIDANSDAQGDYASVDEPGDDNPSRRAAGAYIGQPKRTANTMILWEAGCRVDGGWNCTTACYDQVQGPGMVWDSSQGMWTLQNCLVYPLLAAAAGLEALVEEPPGTLEKYGILKNATWASVLADETNVNSLFPVVTNCTQQYCSIAVDACNPLSDQYYYNAWIDIVPLPGIAYRPDIAIFGRTENVNQDIGGPGVSVSLLLQVCILLAAWLFIDMNLGWLQKFGQLIRLLPKNGVGWRVFRFPTQRSALIIALVEFQKTQVFFALTLQIALILAYRNSALLEATSWSQIQANIDFFPFLGILGVVPVVLNLITLRKEKKELEWYIIGISAICVVVSATTSFIAADVVPSSAQSKDPKIQLDVCGGFSPVYTAYTTGPTIDPDQWYSLTMVTLPVPLLVMACILVDKLGRSPAIEKRFSVHQRLHRRYQSMPRWLQVTFDIIIGFIQFAVEFWLVFTAVFVALRQTDVSPNSVWTLGQIIAVAIWVPAFVNWIYAALAGVEKAFKHVLSRDYRIIRRTTKERTMSSDITTRQTDDEDEHDKSTGAVVELHDLDGESATSRHRLRATSTD